MDKENNYFYQKMRTINAIDRAEREFRTDALDSTTTKAGLNAIAMALNNIAKAWVLSTIKNDNIVKVEDN